MDRQATYICLFCLPKRVHFTGYGPLRMHLRTQHSVKRQSTTESNRFRSDGGYMLDETHYFPNSPGFEPWRATGYGVKPVPPPAPASQTSSKVEMSPTELSSMIVTIMSQMSNQVQAGVGNTIQNAASMLSFMGATPAINQATTSRCFYPVPHTNNVLVAISNPPVAVSENMPAVTENMPVLQLVAAPEKNYTTTSAEESARTSGKSTEEESDTFTEDTTTTPTIDSPNRKVEILSSEILAAGQGEQVPSPNEKPVEPNTASSQVDTVNQDEVTVEEILSELEREENVITKGLKKHAETTLSENTEENASAQQPAEHSAEGKGEKTPLAVDKNAAKNPTVLIPVDPDTSEGDMPPLIEVAKRSRATATKPKVTGTKPKVQAPIQFVPETKPHKSEVLPDTIVISSGEEPIVKARKRLANNQPVRRVKRKLELSDHPVQESGGTDYWPADMDSDDERLKLIYPDNL